MLDCKSDLFHTWLISWPINLFVWTLNSLLICLMPVEILFQHALRWQDVHVQDMIIVCDPLLLSVSTSSHMKLSWYPIILHSLGEIVLMDAAWAPSNAHENSLHGTRARWLTGDNWCQSTSVFISSILGGIYGIYHIHVCKLVRKRKWVLGLWEEFYSGRKAQFPLL